MKHGSLFTGVGGFDLAFERAGFESAFQCEIDKFCLKVLERRFPNATRYTDVRSLNGKECEQVDILTGGFPCQDLSIAGKRAGLAGDRSGLFWEIIRILRDLRPRWLVLENVPGLLSSNDGEDFWSVLSALSECGYFLEWAVLDSRYFGVPQRRRRVYIIGHYGAPPCEPILLERASLRGDTQPRGAEGQAAPSGVEGNPGADSGNCPSLIARYNSVGNTQDGITLAATEALLNAEDDDPEPAAGLVAFNWHEGGQEYPDDKPCLIANQIPAIGALGKASNAGGTVTPQDIAQGHLVAERPIGFSSTRHSEYKEAPLSAPLKNGGDRQELGSLFAFTPRPDYSVDARSDGSTPPVMAESGINQSLYLCDTESAQDAPSEQAAGNPICIRGGSIGREPGNGGDGRDARDDGDTFTLNATDRHLVALDAFHCKPEEVSQPLSRDGQDSHTKLLMEDNPPSPTISGGFGSGGNYDYHYRNTAATGLVRRLTPLECERLQSFPDRWTCLCDKEPCSCPDAPRYRSMGNAVTVKTIEYIARRIAYVDALEREQERSSVL